MEDCGCVGVRVCLLERSVEGCVCDKPAVSWVAGGRASSIQHSRLPVHEEALK